MRGDLAAKVRPATPVAVREFNTAPTSTAGEGKSEASQVDFMSLINKSNSEAKKERDAKAAGTGLSGKESYNDFLEKLQKKNETARVPKNTLDKDDFLRLFVTQLQNQDPTSPEDSSEMASRLAQFNGLEQQLNSNKTLTAILDGQKENRSLDLVNYVGKDVEIEGGRLKFEGAGKEVEAKFSTDKPIVKAMLEVRDSSGTIVATKDLGNLNEGEQKTTWNGRLTDGKLANAGVYSFTVNAKGINGEDIPVKVSSNANITGVDLRNKDGMLYSNMGNFKLADIKSIGLSGYQKEKVVKEPVNQAQQVKQQVKEVAPPAEQAMQVPPELLQALMAAAQKRGNDAAPPAQENPINQVQTGPVLQPGPVTEK